MIFWRAVVGRPPTASGAGGFLLLPRQSQEGDLYRNIELVALHAALADIDGELDTLAQSGRTQGKILIRREYYQHERQKVLKQIWLLRQESEIEKLEAAYEFSQTPGAHKDYKRRIMRLMASRATGGSRETHLPLPPHVAAKTALDRAVAERQIVRRELQELCNRDPEWKVLRSKTVAKGTQAVQQQVPAAPSRKSKALSPFNELAGRLMTEVRPTRSDKRRLTPGELNKVLRAIDKDGFKPLDHLGRKWRKQLADWNQKNSRRCGAIQSFLHAARNPRFRRGVLKRLYEAEQQYRKAHFPLSTI